MACAAATLGLYALLLGVARDIKAARPSHAWELFPWVERLARGREDQQALHAAAAGPILGLLLAVLLIYGLAMYLVAGRRSRLLEVLVFGSGALFLIVQLFGAALLSNDVYSYIMHGRIFGVYGGNPNLEAPRQFPGDLYLRLVEWRNAPSSRGPLWTILSAGLALVGGERIGVTVLLFRSLGTVAALAAAATLWSCLRQLAPRQTSLGLVLFLWNPLVVLESGLSGHSDIVMAALLLLAFRLHLRRRRALASAALVLAVLIKFIAGLIVPLYVLLILREAPSWSQRARHLAVCGASATVVLALVHGAAGVRPDVPVFQALRAEGGRYTHTVHELVFTALRLQLGDEPKTARAPWQREQWIRERANESAEPTPAATQATLWLRSATWLAFGLVWLLAAWRVADPRTFLISSTAVFLAFYWLVGTWVQPWYVIWALALAALVPTSRPAQLAVLLSVGLLSVYVTGGYDYADSPLWWLYAYRSLPAFVLPILIFALIELARRQDPHATSDDAEAAVGVQSDCLGKRAVLLGKDAGG
ncbi:MAG: hypothetical protein H0W09_07195 [Solirubrobacterales bacterium]|nr:hypothetical protein [Solirubrobacterales bacterium]